jgi:hypothetical protein
MGVPVVQQFVNLLMDHDDVVVKQNGLLGGSFQTGVPTVPDDFLHE